MYTDSKTNKPKKNLLFLFSYEKKRETLDCFMLRNDGNRGALDPRIREDDRNNET
jgi:hypothetical protein